jgi:hypothetical protein
MSITKEIWIFRRFHNSQNSDKRDRSFDASTITYQ